MDKFLKVQNFQICKDALCNWMISNYGFDLNQDPDMDPSDLLFGVMKNVKNENMASEDITVKELNNIALNQLQNTYVTKYGLQKKTLKTTRDSDLYGNRPVTTAKSSQQLMPLNTTNKDFDDVNRQFDMILSSRGGGLQQNQPDKTLGTMLKGETEVAIPNDVFASMMDEAKNAYMNLDKNIEIKRPLIADNPKALYEKPSEEEQAHAQMQADATPVFSFQHMQMDISDTDANQSKGTPTTHSAAVVIDMPKKRMILNKYITINGFDREWCKEPMRCHFSVDFNNLSTNYRNIAAIKAMRLIVPNEVIETKTMLNFPKYVQHHDHKLAYPYLLLHIDELSDVYDGFNQTVQRAFAQFVYDTSYRCPNGRGYVVMKLAQDESKIFYPQNLSAIQRLTFSIRKPSGALLNENRDDYNVMKVEYESYNTLYIKIVVDKYFDKNEFYIGDSVIVRNFSMYRPASAPPDMPMNDFTLMNQFINRPEGHEILQLGEANENCFYRSYYVLGPGKVDKTIGKFCVNKCLVDALREYNTLVAPTNNGTTINLSLQNVISLTIEQDVADRGILQTRPI